MFSGSSYHLIIAPWFQCGTLVVNFGLLFDSLGFIILWLVSLISFVVHLYSASYMSQDPHLSRFISFLGLFTFFIFLLITADNLLLFFIGWEGVGLCSFLLINFWHIRIQANKAAIKAIVLNRIGDFGLVLGIVFLFFSVGSIDFTILFTLFPFSLSSTISFFGFSVKLSDLIVFFIFLGAVGKSAQVGLHTWLPDAIEGPTPVSALIHSATMVTAGVFLLLRCSALFEYCPQILWFVVLIGSVTALISAVIGLFQNDIKKVIAYSTCSQLGYLVFSCGLSSYNLSFFHLINHGFFKALLFLTAGGIIHAVSDEQDMRKFGGLVRLLPFSFSIIIVGSLALAGFPFFSGFYSKEILLELAFSSFSSSSHFAYLIGSLSALLTAFYSGRSLYLIFLSVPRGKKRIFEFVHEVPSPILTSILILGVFSLFSGYFLQDSFSGVSSIFFSTSLYTHPVNYSIIDAEFLSIFIKLVPLVLSLLGGVFSLLLYFIFNKTFYFFKTSFIGRVLYSFFNRKWFFDKFYTDLISQSFFSFCSQSVFLTFDKGVLEVLGPYGVSFSLVSKAWSILALHTGNISNYSYLLFSSVSFLFVLWFFYFCGFTMHLFFVFICFVVCFFSGEVA